MPSSAKPASSLASASSRLTLLERALYVFGLAMVAMYSSGGERAYREEPTDPRRFGSVISAGEGNDRVIQRYMVKGSQSSPNGHKIVFSHVS